MIVFFFRVYTTDVVGFHSHLGPFLLFVNNEHSCGRLLLSASLSWAVRLVGSRVGKINCCDIPTTLYQDRTPKTEVYWARKLQCSFIVLLLNSLLWLWLWRIVDGLCCRQISISLNCWKALEADELNENYAKLIIRLYYSNKSKKVKVGGESDV